MDEKLAKKELMRDIINKLKASKDDYFIVPDHIFETLAEVAQEHGLTE